VVARVMPVPETPLGDRCRAARSASRANRKVCGGGPTRP
jgi:hypothetical protein